DNKSGGYTVTVKVTDKDGGFDSKSFNVDVHNVAPTLTPRAQPQNANEGASTPFSLGTFSDPGVNDAPWSVDVDWGDSSAHTIFTTMSQGTIGAKSHSYADNGSHTVTDTVTDKDHGSDTKTFTINVANVPPAVTAAANQSSNEGSSASFDLGSFSDPGVNDKPWAVDVNWGDGTPHTSLDPKTDG